MLRAGQAFREIKLLRTVPGVGPIGACRFSAYIHTPNRFSSKRKLWKYDFDAGKYVEAPGDASGQYVPNLRKPAKPLTFAFAEGWAAIPFSVSINKGIYRIAGDLGIKIIYCDQEFKPEKAVTCAEQLSSVPSSGR